MPDAQRKIEHRILAQHRVIAERLRSDPGAVIARARANLDRWAKKYGDDERPRWMREWMALLDGPVDAILELLTSRAERAVRLRSSSPFAGVISARERWRILKEADREAS
ncbi:hypothetical protein [Endothiovibrio diazotrophicus]